MAKLIGPLHSLHATGTLAHTITYTGSTGGARAIRYKAPTGTGTPARRALYAAGCAAWALLTPEQKTTWKITGAERRMSGFSTWMSAYLLAPPVSGTVWDGGLTTWDGGATVWDT